MEGTSEHHASSPMPSEALQELEVIAIVWVPFRRKNTAEYDLNPNKWLLTYSN